jgi:hypothetical protein
MLRAILATASIAASMATAAAEPVEQPLGIAWSPVYGFPPSRLETFVPQARALGAGPVRVTIYWSQIQPADGVTRWDVLDAFLAQVDRPDQAILTIASASPWATRSHAWVFPSSPAADPARYEAFVRELVAHVHGRIRYFQAENEPNNPFFWAGSADEYAAEQRRFHRAVKAADPAAVVILGASDGLFDPSGVDPFPGQEKDLAFVAQVVKAAAGAFDLFDLHGYGNPYTIPARVDAVRALMRAAGDEKPVVSTEASGPSFFEFKANRRHAGALLGPGAGPDSVRALRADESLPPEARMFLHPDDPQLAQRLARLQAEDLVVRTLVMLASGVRRVAFFEMVRDGRAPDTPNSVLYDHMALFTRAADGALVELPLAARFRRLATALAGTTTVTRLAVADQPDVHAYRVERTGRPALFVAWRRPALPGAAVTAADATLPAAKGTATTIEGEAVPGSETPQGIRLPLSDMPVLIEP